MMLKFGWKPDLEELFKKYNQDILSENQGTFTIMLVNGSWYWYYKLSSHKTNRMKYLCGCEIENNSESFDNACEILKKKIKSSFQNIKVNDTLITYYIDEYITHLSKIGGWKIETRNRGDVKYDVWVPSNTDTIFRNSNSIRNKLYFAGEFRKYCEENKIKVGIVPHREMKIVFKDYAVFLKTRTKRRLDGKLVNDGKTLERGTIKSFLQNCRYFLDWLTTPIEEDGRELFKEHQVTLEYQTHILKSIIGESKPKLDYVDFKQSNYDNCIKDTISFIREIWIEYCKSKGNIEQIREKRLSYPIKTKEESGIVNTPHKNQPKDSVVMSDIVYFVSFLQLRYGFRISEILHSFRNYDGWFQYKKDNLQSSYFRVVDEKDEYYYVLEIRNSKLKNRNVPIEECIFSWDVPPNTTKYKIVKNGKNTHYETNIIDVIFTIFPNSALVFPSPNYYTKKDIGYSTNYYLNLFKEKMVRTNEENLKLDPTRNYGLGWSEYGILSSHHLRSFFISYMLRKNDVLPLDVCEITGHNLNTMMKYYMRVSEESKRTTLKKSKLRDILKS